MSNQIQLIPIHRTSGTVGAFLKYPYLYNLQGEWIGWVTPDRQVYSVHGHHVGRLDNGPRIVRLRSGDDIHPRYPPPPPPSPIRPPASVPLSPLLRELSFSEIDVLDDYPELLPTLDYGELREDMD